MKYKVNYHFNISKYFKNDMSRPIIKKCVKETYILPQKELVVEQVEEIIAIMSKINNCDEKAIFEFWNRTKNKLEEWIVLFAERRSSNFKSFTINVSDFHHLHDLDSSCDEDESYIKISVL